MTSLLPEDAQDEIPVGFAIVGHVGMNPFLQEEHFWHRLAHLNLRDEYLQYKHVIAEVLIDKNPIIRTVINKVNDVGTHSEYRTFGYEVLAGPDDMHVELSEENCIFRFDYSKVYWNSRLQTEHKRLVDSFSPGEVVCDVMAGIGPFAIPAGKKGVFVWANDLNPDSYAAMVEAINRNKVRSPFRLKVVLLCKDEFSSWSAGLLPLCKRQSLDSLKFSTVFFAKILHGHTCIC
jgi:tRNA (guanine37-N1)-methyltransferase